MSVVGIRAYPEGVFDLVKVSAGEAYLAYCADCGRADCPRWLADHKAETGHGRVYFVRPERQQQKDRPVKSRRRALAAPTQYDGPLTCFFSVAHSAPELTGTARCKNCGALVEIRP